MSWLDVPGQLGNMLFISLYPSMVERGGWSLVFRTLQGTTLCGSAVCIAYLLLDGKSSAAPLFRRLPLQSSTGTCRTAADPTQIFTKRLVQKAEPARAATGNLV